MKRTFWALALAVLAATCMAQGVEVEFLTPRIVHIVKYATTEYAKKDQPKNVEITIDGKAHPCRQTMGGDASLQARDGARGD